MGAFFLDSSALAKRYVRETGTSFVLELFRARNNSRVYVANLTLVEVTAAIARRERSGSISTADARKSVSRFRKHFSGTFRIVELTSPLIERAAELAEARGLRAYDSVQLSSALIVNEERIAQGAAPIIFVCADAALNSAAISEGLSVDNPNDH
jgi:uncharacterized protein